MRAIVVVSVSSNVGVEVCSASVLEHLERRLAREPWAVHAVASQRVVDVRDGGDAIF